MVNMNHDKANEVSSFASVSLPVMSTSHLSRGYILGDLMVVALSQVYFCLREEPLEDNYRERKAEQLVPLSVLLPPSAVLISYLASRSCAVHNILMSCRVCHLLNDQFFCAFVLLKRMR